MKTLLVIRHAKSSWGIGSLDDFDRPLTERGKKDAPMMAQRLLDKKISIDAFVSSPAKRAKKTATLFCEKYQKEPDKIIFVPELYHAGIENFYNTIEQIPEKNQTVALFSHNPGITYFINGLVEEVHIDIMPTCAVFAIQINAETWKEFKEAKKNFLFFDYPKISV
jgi:phosphohistidine phosphatase